MGIKLFQVDAFTSLATASQYDVVSRYFAPWVGVDEDPVTGSVHCCLGPSWCQRLGRQELTAYFGLEIKDDAGGGAMAVSLAAL